MSHTATYEFPVQRATRPAWFWIAASFALRGYLAIIWLRFGLAKLRDGWLTSNPLKPLLTLVGANLLPTTAPGYAPIARLIVSTHADALLAVAIPLTEIAIGAALVSGFRVRTTALIACALNVNLLLSGLASWSLDGRMLLLQAILIAALTLDHTARKQKAEPR